VQKSECKADKRLVDIILTEKGLQLVTKLDQYNDQIDANLKGVSAAEASTINQILDKLRSAVNNK
jgi:DNA-binding MarR family transcriptional regulator